jgi:hypothetical protein
MRNRLCLLSVLTIATSLGAGSAIAGDVTARAEQNPATLVVNSSPGASITAAVPSAVGSGASASTTRTRIDLAIDGDGSTATTAFAAQGFNDSDYQLVWLDDGSALTQSEADAYDLSFDFRAVGRMEVRTVSLSRGSVGIDVKLFSSGAQEFDVNLVQVFGPTGSLVIGDTAYVGAFDQRFSLLHQSDADGKLTMQAQGSAAFEADTDYTLLLEAITLARGDAPARGLGIKLLDTGETIRIVPEPSTWGLMLAGLLCVGGLVRRRAA